MYLGKKKNDPRKKWEFFLKDFIDERGREKERQGEKHQLVVSCMPPTGGLVCNPGMCPGWESNQRSFGSQASAQSTDPCQSY